VGYGLLGAAVAACVGCGDNLAADRGPDLALHDEIFASPTDHGILCAANANDDAYKLPSIRDALDRARDQGEIVQLFVHDPGKNIAMTKLEAILEGANDRGLRFVTYRELAAGTTGPGIAIGFDDWFVEDWAATEPMLAAYGARVTYFPALYLTYTAEQKQQLHRLEDDGHDIEFHSTHHLAAPQFVDQFGLDAYIPREIDPGLDAMRADGFDPVVFAYPAGLRTPELDAALLGSRFKALRATTNHCPH
jgi:peptidoglycan/xylan/chitin deacetylase (PgdA/CDA1 family)